MLLLRVDRISKVFGERVLFKDLSLEVYQGDKIGLIGSNGIGKSTLLHLIAGDLVNEKGNIQRFGSISYLKQLQEELIKTFKDENAHLDEEINSRLDEAISSQLVKEEKQFAVHEKINQEVVSGGEEMRLKIAKVFSKRSLLYLLDEPTANLDEKGAGLVKDKINALESYIIVSHDRALLNACCNQIWEIRDKKIICYSGNYDEYKRLREHEIQRNKTEYEAYIMEKKRLETIYVKKKEAARAIAKIPKGISKREANLRNFLCVTGRNYGGKQRSMNKSAENVRKRMEKLEVKEKPQNERTMHIDFSLTNPPENQYVISSEKFSLSFKTNVIFKDTKFRIPRGKRIALVGENGSGKTTLLNAIMRSHNGIERENISIVPKARIAYFKQNLDSLSLEKSVLENMYEGAIQSEKAIRSVLAKFLFSAEDINKKAEVLSGGERIKLNLAKLFISEHNVLLLDEPTNYLDMPSILALQQMLEEYQGTVILVSHDEMFVDEVAQELLIIKNQQLCSFQGNIKQYKAYRNEELHKELRKNKKEIEEQRMLLELRKANIIGRFGRKHEDKEALEIEYQNILKQIYELDLIRK